MTSPWCRFFLCLGRSIFGSSVPRFFAAPLVNTLIITLSLNVGMPRQAHTLWSPWPPVVQAHTIGQP